MIEDIVRELQENQDSDNGHIFTMATLAEHILEGTQILVEISTSEEQSLLQVRKWDLTQGATVEPVTLFEKQIASNYLSELFGDNNNEAIKALYNDLKDLVIMATLK